MKIRGIYLKNFRGYRDKKIAINQDLTVIVGKNDAGKSTVLEAIDIFLGGGTVKIDKDDKNVNSGDEDLVIGLAFELTEQEKRIVLDESRETNLENEMLLNGEGLLEIHKRYNLSGRTIRYAVFINAYYLNNIPEPLIKERQRDLQQKYRELPQEYQTADDIRVNKELRQTIHNYYNSLDDTKREIIFELPTTSSYEFRAGHIEALLPTFYLFQADKRNIDSEKDVQDPLKAIIKEAGQAYLEQIAVLSSNIKEQVEILLSSTVEKMKDFDEAIAEEIKPIVEEKDLDSLFSVNFNTPDDVPIYKRGSGFRRLLMLSYFRAIAEGYEAATTEQVRTIIYGVEEPENSQHPCNQKMIFTTFKEIAMQENRQVLLTSHTPAISHFIKRDELILVDKTESGNEIRYGNDTETIKRVIDTLGIHPNFIEKVLWCVEGQNDKNFLLSINKGIEELKSNINLEEVMIHNHLSIFPMNGSLLEEYIKRDYLRGTSILEFHLYDNDVQRYNDLIQEINSDSDKRRTGRNTVRRKMELYCHPDLVISNWKDEISVSTEDWTRIREKWINGDVDFDPIDWLMQKGVMNVFLQNEKGQRKRENSIKGTINKLLAGMMTKDMMEEMGTYEEIENWFAEIKRLCDQALA